MRAVAERMNRDEHVAAIRQQLADARELQFDGPQETLATVVEALIYVGDQVASLFERLGPPPSESAWKWAHTSLVHSSGDWEIEYIHGCETDEKRPHPGWYLYGRALKGRGPLWMGASPDEAMEYADKGIAGVVQILPRTWSWNGTEYNLDLKYRSTRGDFVIEFVGTLTDGMPLVREYPAGVRAMIQPFATVHRMMGPFVSVDEVEVPF